MWGEKLADEFGVSSQQLACLLALQECTNSCFPCTVAAKQEQKTCLLSLTSFRQHPRVSHETLHLCEWERPQALMSLCCYVVFFRIKYHTPSHLERGLTQPNGEEQSQKWGNTNGKGKERNCKSAKRSLLVMRSSVFQSLQGLCLALWSLSHRWWEGERGERKRFWGRDRVLKGWGKFTPSPRCAAYARHSEAPV